MLKLPVPAPPPPSCPVSWRTPSGDIPIGNPTRFPHPREGHRVFPPPSPSGRPSESEGKIIATAARNGV